MSDSEKTLPIFNLDSLNLNGLSKPITTIGLIAGEGHLPVVVAQTIARQGIPLASFPIFSDNHRDLKALSQTCETIVPGLFHENRRRFQSAGVSHLVFAGKVNKWLLLRKPVMDDWALKTLKSVVFRNDDGFMHSLIAEIQGQGFEILPQTAFLQSLMQPPGLLTQTPLSPAIETDLAYGLPIAKGVAGLDIGQTIVVHQGMLMAVEAIEGTDECLKRAGHWARKKGGTVIKVAKPNQDQRFDVPTVGLRTLKAMRRSGLTVLATEAHQTLYLEKEAMVAYANRHGMTILSIEVDHHFSDVSSIKSPAV